MATYRYSSRDATFEERFNRFLDLHPEVYTEFKRLAFQLVARGVTHYGAKAIMEVIRFHRTVNAQDEREPFKINNDYTSRLARKLIDEDTRFTHFFELRELRSR